MLVSCDADFIPKRSKGFNPSRSATILLVQLCWRRSSSEIWLVRTCWWIYCTSSSGSSEVSCESRQKSLFFCGFSVTWRAASFWEFCLINVKREAGEGTAIAAVTLVSELTSRTSIKRKYKWTSMVGTVIRIVLVTHVWFSRFSFVLGWF